MFRGGIQCQQRPQGVRDDYDPLDRLLQFGYGIFYVRLPLGYGRMGKVGDGATVAGQKNIADMVCIRDHGNKPVKVPGRSQNSMDHHNSGICIRPVPVKWAMFQEDHLSEKMQGESRSSRPIVLFDEIANTVCNILGSIGEIIDILDLGHAGKYKNCIHIGFNTCDDIGIHAVAYENDLITVAADLF